MEPRTKRALAAVAASLLAAAGGVVTNVVTDSPSWAWGITLAVLVLAGTATQVCLSSGPSAQVPSVRAQGPGSIAIGGSAHGPVSARGSGSAADGTPSPPGQGITASGPGSVAIGGNALSSVRSTSGGPS